MLEIVLEIKRQSSLQPKLFPVEGQLSFMSESQQKKLKTGGGGVRDVQRKRGAEEDLDVPTLGQVAEAEEDFAPLRQLLEPVKNRPVSEFGKGLRSKLEKKVGEELDLLLEAFFAACDARVSEAAHKRVHMASKEHSPGKQQRWLFFLSLFFLSLSLSPLCALALPALGTSLCLKKTCGVRGRVTGDMSFV